MPERKTIQSWLETAAAQIRWRRARPVLTRELAQHLEDQRDAFVAEGQENAEALAVEEMGDPVAVGAELDRVHRPDPQWRPLAAALVLAATGAVLRVWLTAGWSDRSADPVRSSLAVILGGIVLLTCYFLDFSALGRRPGALYLGSLAVCLAAVAWGPEIANVAYAARYAALWLPAVYACWAFGRRRSGWSGLVLTAAGILPPAAVCLLIPDTFGLLALLLTAALLLFSAAGCDWFGLGRRKTAWAALVFTAAAAAPMAAIFLRSRRLLVALHPELDPLGWGYSALAVRRALSAARALGEGAETAPPIQAVPNAGSDAFLTTLICKLGWLPFLAVVLTFALLMAWLLHRRARHQSQLGRAVVLAAAVALCLQALCSAAWSLGFTLLGGTFPLLVGNWNTVMDLGLLGLALSVFREERIARDAPCSALPRWRVKVTIQRVS